MSINKNFWIYAAAMSLSGFLFNFIASFPGQMTYDSFVMYNMGVKWNFNDWHHPFVSALMGLGHFILNDPSPYLFFQLTLFWSGVFLLSLAFHNQTGKWAILVPCIALMPFNIALSGYLHKTPLLSACFLFSFSWLFFLYSKNKKLGLAQFIVLIPFLFLGSVVRGYTYLAAFPLLVFMVWMLIHKEKKSWHEIIKALTISLFLTIVFILLNHFLVYDVLKSKRIYKHQILYKIDMAGVNAITGKMYGIEFLKPQFKEPVVAREFYDSKMRTEIWRVISMYKYVYTPEEVGRMRTEWWNAISENFPAYLEHRKNMFLKTFEVTSGVSSFRGFDTKSRKNINDLRKYYSVLYFLLKKYVLSVKYSFFMKPWFWAVSNSIFSIIGFGMLFIPRYRDLVLPHCVILWSGLLLLAPYSLICLSTEHRFTYWVTLATSFGGFGIVTTLLKRPDDSIAGQQIVSC